MNHHEPATAEPLTPSHPYSGERGGRRGGPSIGGNHDGRGSSHPTITDVERTLPLSPALSPVYREEGERFS